MAFEIDGTEADGADGVAADGEGGSLWADGSPDLIAHQGRRWLPVEITIPAEGFTAAWRVGAREWRTADAANAAATTDTSAANIYPMRENWQTYPPVSVAASSVRLPALPSEAAISAALAAQEKTLASLAGGGK